MARFMDSDDNYMTYRRFGNVQARLLLEAQDDVRILEEKLEDLDDEETANEGEANALCSRKLYGASWSESRKDLMKSLKAAFNEYGKLGLSERSLFGSLGTDSLATLMGSAQTLMSLNRPTSHEYTSVENFMNNEKPVSRPQLSFIYRKEDLVTLRPGREHAWLDSQVEKLLKACDGRLVQVSYFLQLHWSYLGNPLTSALTRKSSLRLRVSRKRAQRPLSKSTLTESGLRHSSTQS